MRTMTDNTDKSLHQYTFRAMNAAIDLTFYCSHEDASFLEMLAKDWFRDVEERFSRFKPDSELSYLNRLAGERCMVSDTMLEVLLLAEQYRNKTDGLFDPLILNALRQAGYDETYDQVALRDEAFPYSSPVAPTIQPIMSINAAMKSIQLPDQTAMDLGGIVKSWAVQRFADYLQHRVKLECGIINAGGDLTVWNSLTEAAQPWTVGIENPWDAQEDIGQLVMANGASATSSKLGRRWETTQGTMHHLIHPRVMSPSVTDAVQCTVAGANVVECEIWAKVICILGCHAGLALLAAHTDAYEALVFTAQQETHYYGKKFSLGKRWLGVGIDHYHDSNSDALQNIGGGRYD